MTAVLDLINLYSDINREIINENMDPRGMNRHFRTATDQMHQIRHLLQQLTLSKAAP